MKTTIYSNLINSIELTAYLPNKYSPDNGVTTLEPVFSEIAPENAKKPYITYEVSRRETESKVIQEFDITIEYWHIDSTREKAERIAEIVEDIFDLQRFESADYSAIRFWYNDNGWVNEDDPRTVRHANNFYSRASRKRWSEKIT